jgi:hypothetical protein
MTDNDNKNQTELDNVERRQKDRRSHDLPDDVVNRRKNKDRRVKDEEIDFDNRRKEQRRKPIVGVDIEERRKTDRRKDK